MTQTENIGPDKAIYLQWLLKAQLKFPLSTYQIPLSDERDALVVITENEIASDSVVALELMKELLENGLVISFEEIADIDIEALTLSTKVSNAFINHNGVTKVGQLAPYFTHENGREYLGHFRNIGDEAIKEILKNLLELKIKPVQMAECFDPLFVQIAEETKSFYSAADFPVERYNKAYEIVHRPKKQNMIRTKRPSNSKR